MSGIHQITIKRSGQVLITKERDQRLKRYSYQIKDPGKFAAWLCRLPCMNFAHEKSGKYTLFVKKIKAQQG